MCRPNLSVRRARSSTRSKSKRGEGIKASCNTLSWTATGTGPHRCQGKCPDCGSAMVSKCGPRVIHHWAHASRKNCDPWWENETDWHREWKSHFPEDCREVSHTAPDGEVHRADIKTPTGIVIEVQHSTMSDEERESRESFYGNLIWILDGRNFRKSFHLGYMLPEPSAEWVKDIVWFQPPRSTGPFSRESIEDQIPPFWRLSDIEQDYPELQSRIYKKSCLHRSWWRFMGFIRIIK